jgi:hypothetical protein
MSRFRTSTTYKRKKPHKVNKKPLQERRETSISLSYPKGSIKKGMTTL